MRYVKKAVAILLVCSLFMSGCGIQEQGKNEKIEIKLAVFEEDRDINKQVEIFNQENEAYQIVITKYGRERDGEEDGIARLQREIVSGQGPDIIDYGSHYSVSDIVGEYTDDLLPYVQQEEQESGAVFLPNILDAFMYRDSLRVMPTAFSLDTFAANAQLVQNKEGWNIQELENCYHSFGGDVFLYLGQMQVGVFANLLMENIDYFIDWESGESSFEGEEFKELLKFAKEFPENLNLSNEQLGFTLYEEQRVLLVPSYISNFFDIAYADAYFGKNNVSYIGYPVNEGYGTIVKPYKNMLAISMSSQHKDIAWEFIAGFLKTDYQEAMKSGFPIEKTALLRKLESAQEIQYEKADDGTLIPAAQGQVLVAEEAPIDIYALTPKQADTLLTMIEKSDRCSTLDDNIWNIMWEEAMSFFAGDKTVDEAAEMIQSRVNIYVNERI